MMKTANDFHQLIVAASYDQERLTPLIPQLSQMGQLDAYSVRQRLIGNGLAQLAKGPLEQLRPMANLLRQYRLNHWIVQPPTTPLEPVTIKALTIEPQQITFYSNDSEITLERGTLYWPSSPTCLESSLKNRSNGFSFTPPTKVLLPQQ